MQIPLIRSERIPPALLAGAAAGVVYLLTLAPGLTFIDAGELATTAWTLGIAHPSGYPLFTLLGWAAAHLPLGLEPILVLNAMAALLCAAGVGVFTTLLERLLGPGAGGAALGGGLLLAFSETYWMQATAIEVYSLHCLFLSLLLYVFILALERQGEPVDRRWWLLAFLLGLSFTNHLTTVLLAPAFLYYYFARGGNWRRVFLLVLPFLLGLSLYLYLPLRTLGRPAMNWGNPDTIERFFWHVSGGQYRIWIFTSAQTAGRQLSYFFRTLLPETGYIGGVLAAAGLYRLWRRDRKLLLFTVLLFAGCVAYAVNYDIHDIDSYFLLAYFAFAIWAAFGLAEAGALVRGIPGGGWWLACAALVPLIVNWDGANERQNHVVEDYARNMYSSLAPGALVLSYQWDYWVSASYYDQIVRGVRPDLTVVDKELLRRSWYLEQLERRYPSLIAGSRGEVEAFLREVYRFEHKLPYDGGVIEGRYAGMIRSFLERSLEKGPVYVTEEIEPVYTQGFQRVPEGLALRLYRDTLFHPTSEPIFSLRPIRKEGRLEGQVRRLYAGAWVARGDYVLVRRSDRAGASGCYRKALEFLPGDPGILARLAGAGNMPVR